METWRGSVSVFWVFIFLATYPGLSHGKCRRDVHRLPDGSDRPAEDNSTITLLCGEKDPTAIASVENGVFTLCLILDDSGKRKTNVPGEGEAEPPLKRWRRKRQTRRPKPPIRQKPRDPDPVPGTVPHSGGGGVGRAGPRGGAGGTGPHIGGGGTVGGGGGTGPSTGSKPATGGLPLGRPGGSGTNRNGKSGKPERPNIPFPRNRPSSPYVLMGSIALARRRPICIPGDIRKNIRSASKGTKHTKYGKCTAIHMVGVSINTTVLGVPITFFCMEEPDTCDMNKDGQFTTQDGRTFNAIQYTLRCKIDDAIKVDARLKIHVLKENATNVLGRDMVVNDIKWDLEMDYECMDNETYAIQCNQTEVVAMVLLDIGRGKDQQNKLQCGSGTGCTVGSQGSTGGSITFDAMTTVDGATVPLLDVLPTPGTPNVYGLVFKSGSRLTMDPIIEPPVDLQDITLLEEDVGFGVEPEDPNGGAGQQPGEGGNDGGKDGEDVDRGAGGQPGEGGHDDGKDGKKGISGAGYASYKCPDVLLSIGLGYIFLIVLLLK